MTPRISRHRRIFLVSACALLVLGSGFFVTVVPWLMMQKPGLPINAVHAEGTGRVRVTAPVVLMSSPRLVIENGVVSLAPEQAAQAQTKLDLLSLISSGNADLVLEDATLSLEAGQQAGNTQGARSLLVETLLKASFLSLSMKNCKMVVKRSGGREETLSKLTATLAKDGSAALKITGQFDLRQERVSIEAAIGTQSAKSGNDDLPIELALSSKHIEGSVNGKLVLSKALQLIAQTADVQVPSLTAAANWLGGAWPEIPGVSPLRMTGAMDWLGDTVTFSNARIELSEHAASGSLSLTAGQRRPLIEGTLAFDDLDVSKFVKPALGPDPQHAGDQWRIESILPSDVSRTLLHEVDADLRVSASRVTDGTSVLGRGAGSVSIKSGVANAAFAELESEGGGTGNLEVEVDANGNVPSYTLNGRMSSFETSALMATLFGYPAMTGRAEISADLSATGISSSQIRESLGGKITMSAATGITIATDLLSLIRKTGTQPRVGWPASSGQSQMRLDSFTTRVEAARGRLKVATFEGLVGAQKIFGYGTADLGTRTIDLEIEAHTLAAPRTALKAGAITVKSINVQGAWPNPTVRASAPAAKRSQSPDELDRATRKRNKS